MASLEEVTGSVIEEVIGGWAAPMLFGVGVVLAPVAFPGLFKQLRPVAKGLIKGGLLAADRAREVVAEASEQWSDLVAETRVEMSTSAAGDILRNAAFGLSLAH